MRTKIRNPHSFSKEMTSTIDLNSPLYTSEIWLQSAPAFTGTTLIVLCLQNYDLRHGDLCSPGKKRGFSCMGTLIATLRHEVISHPPSPPPQVLLQNKEKLLMEF